MTVCELCHWTGKNLGNHLAHKHANEITSQKYYDTYIAGRVRRLNTSKCGNPRCENACKFIDLGRGYQSFCSPQCVSAGKYGLVTPELRLVYGRFDSVIQRANTTGLECDFSYCLEDFERFREVVGPVPQEMVCPTVGRVDHSKGYVIGNFGWQDKSENCREVATRLNQEGRIPSTGTDVIVSCPHCVVRSNVVIMKR